MLNYFAAGILPLALSNCANKTVANLVPPAAGTATGSIKVDSLTQVSTVSRIVPGSVTPTCGPGRNAVASAPQWTTSNEGITVTTNRMAPVEGYNHVASGTGNLLQGGGVLTGGIGILKGKMRSTTNIRNSANATSSSTSSATFPTPCADPNSPYIFGN